MRGADATWVGFLAACFVVVGLAGVFATFAVPVPYERALARLGTSVADPGTAAVLRDAAAESAAIANRIRFLLCVLTVLSILFGAVVLRAAQRRQRAVPSTRP